MEQKSALGAARRRWWAIVLLAIVGAALGAIPEPAKVEEQSRLVKYVATHTMLLNTDSASSGSTGVSPNQIALLATTGEVPKRVAETLGVSESGPVLASQVEVLYDFQTGALTFSTTQDTPERAESTANAFAEETNAYLIERQDIVDEQRLAASLARLQALEGDIDEITAQLAFSPNDPLLQAQRDALSRQYSVAFEQSQALAADPTYLAFTTLERAEAIPVEQTSGGLGAPRSRMTRGILGLVAGAAVGLGAAMLLGMIDRRIRTREQAEAILGLRARVEIPQVRDEAQRGLVVRLGRHDALSDSYRTLRNVIGFIHGGLEPVERARVTVVVSPGPGEGKTTLSANLAAAFVETGLQTIAVNTDFRRPRLADTITVGPRVHLPFALEDLDSVNARWLLSDTVDPQMSLLDLSTLGTAGELARATARLLPDLMTTSDAIVVDTSPIGATAEVLELVPLADVIVIVVRVGHTPISMAERSIAILRDLTKAPIVLALTGSSGERTTYYEYADRRRPDRRKATGWRKYVSLRRKPRYTGPERRRSDRGSGAMPPGQVEGRAVEGNREIVEHSEDRRRNAPSEPVTVAGSASTETAATGRRSSKQAK